MSKPTLVPPDATANPVYLTAAAISSLIQALPSGTAYCIGIVLIVMMTGRLMQHKGSLARAALALVLQLRWGWHRVERAMERGKFSLDGLFDRASEGCLTHLEVEPVRLGCQGREVIAIDSSSIARLRCQVGKAALLGKGLSPCGARGACQPCGCGQRSLDSRCARRVGAACAVWGELRSGGEQAVCRAAAE